MDELLKDFLKFIGAVIIWIGFLGQKPFMDILQTSKWKGWAIGHAYHHRCSHIFICTKIAHHPSLLDTYGTNTQASYRERLTKTIKP